MGHKIPIHDRKSGKHQVVPGSDQHQMILLWEVEEVVKHWKFYSN